LALKATLGGVRITMSFSFPAMLAAAVWLGEDVVRLTAAAAVHEGGHLAALYAVGGTVRAIEFGSFGIRIRPRFPRIAAQHAQAVMLLAGPVAGFAAGLAAFFLGKYRFALLSAGLSCFNLLPVPGLDGGELVRILRG